jgi:hypothetical protein
MLTDSTLLHLAAALGHLPVVELILVVAPHTATQACAGCTFPWHAKEVAAQSRQLLRAEGTKVLAEVDSMAGPDFLPIHLAAAFGQSAVVRALL